ncbi:extracellular solute-binding protein [Xylanimonas allomyrinae]|uniref:extracellular solute-binding protein n=1 Tax=Xylanimonas allomyrinae TaxID=2509459 RepID=UPI00248295F3|nr:extracellular solute-binding protein [Xylanimonas allomyrinae]
MIETMRMLRAQNPDVYIGSSAMDFGSMLGLIWAAGGDPFSVDGTTVGINLTDDPGVARVAEVWQTLHDEGMSFPILNWTDEWFRALGDGTIAFLPMGAWMPGNLIGSVPAGEGEWRVAPLPQFEAGGTGTGHHGGSTIAMMDASQNKALAYGFLEFAGVGAGVQPRVDDGIFPDTVEHLEASSWRDAEVEYFGDRQINQVLGDAAANALPGWQFLPFQVYANSIYSDTVGQAFIDQGTIMDGMAAWQTRLESFAETQGFDLKQ